VPAAIRYPRGVGTGVARKAEPATLTIGKAEILQDGSDVAILGLGPLLPMAEELAALLEREGISAAVVNPRFVKPLDHEMLAGFASRVAAFVTFEDHAVMGGFGSAVAEALDELNIEGRVPAVPVVRIGWPNQFIEHGKVDDLRQKHGVSVEAALEQVLPLLAARRRAAVVR
jgi:1-deoxy-D-xylulose-5-phosphate synthase